MGRLHPKIEDRRVVLRIRRNFRVDGHNVRWRLKLIDNGSEKEDENGKKCHKPIKRLRRTHKTVSIILITSNTNAIILKNLQSKGRLPLSRITLTNNRQTT